MTTVDHATDQGVAPAPRAKVRRRGRKQRKSVVLTIVMVIFTIYSMVPLLWLIINATKDQASLFSSFGLWFGNGFDLFGNIADTFTYDNGIFLHWFANTLLYVILGGGGATVLATLGGYGLAKYRFPGRRAVFAVVLGGLAIPGTALAVPTFLLFSKIGLTNTPWAVILPSLISCFGLYLVWTFATDAVPTELMEAARLDGAGEFRIFFTIALPLLDRRHLEQLLPASHHAQRAHLVSAHGRVEPVERASDRCGSPADLQPCDHRISDDHRADRDRLPLPPALLAVRPRCREREAVTETKPPLHQSP